jgi:hypothetical protein
MNTSGHSIEIVLVRRRKAFITNNFALVRYLLQFSHETCITDVDSTHLTSGEETCDTQQGQGDNQEARHYQAGQEEF